MRILIIGGLGFIGSHITKLFCRAGHEVTILTRRRLKSYPTEPQVVVGDAADKVLTARLIAGQDMVIYLASTSTPGTSDEDCATDVVDNLVPLVSLLDCMRDAAVSRLIYFSSGGAVYGQTSAMPIGENTRCAPLTSYGAIKCAAESYIAISARRFGLRPVILRPSNPYGEGQGKIGVQGLISTLLWGAATGEPVEIWGTGEATRDYIHVNDMAQLCLRIAESDVEGTFNVGSGMGHSVNDVMSIIAKVTDNRLRVVRMPGRPSDPEVNVLDCSEVRNQLSWRPRIGLDVGIAMTWQAVLRDAGLDPSTVAQSREKQVIRSSIS